MNEQTKDMLKEAYQYGYAHGIEDTEKQLASILKDHVLNNPDGTEYNEIFETVLQEIMQVLSEFSSDTKKKDLKDYKNKIC